MKKNIFFLSVNILVYDERVERVEDDRFRAVCAPEDVPNLLKRKLFTDVGASSTDVLDTDGATKARKMNALTSPCLKCPVFELCDGREWRPRSANNWKQILGRINAEDCKYWDRWL